MAPDAVCAEVPEAHVAPHISFLHYAPSADTALAALPPEFAAAFREQFPVPTPAQRFAWPVLTRGDNLLLCAPTGMGKTFAAFLPILASLRNNPCADLRCLYIAPLKALVRDVAKNLRAFLRDLNERIPKAGSVETFGGRGLCASTSRFRFDARPIESQVRVGIRTGDTSWKVRRRLLDQPPDILLTTPESLAVLLSQPHARAKLRSLRWIVVDELHALAVTKRGVDLSLSLERLESLVERPLQRIGLSATCSPVEEAARFLMGTDRGCQVAVTPDQGPLDLAVEPLPITDEPRALTPLGAPFGFMQRLLHRLDLELADRGTTLIFANVRSMAERVAWALAKRHPERADRIAVHHGSLAPARRREIERRLKRGELWAIVTSTSLELGIDIGAIDNVVMIHPPGGAARLIQRLGRSGHRPGQRRRGLVLTASPAELLEATITAAAGRDGQIERLAIPEAPLDVLCQHLVGMAIDASWDRAEALALVRRAYPYRNFSESDFSGCLNYLSGRKADGAAWLPPRLAWLEEGRFTLAAEATARLLRRNLGTIISAPPRAIRLVSEEKPEERALLLGSLDEFYADRLQPGDRFLLGGRALEYRRRERATLVVREAGGRPAPPRWGDSGWPLPPELARRLYDFRAAAAEALRDGPDAFAGWLRLHYGLKRAAADHLFDYLSLQETVSEIPDERMVLVEGVAHEEGIEYALHTPLNRAGNEALARVLSLRMERDQRRQTESLSADLGVLLYVRGTVPLELEAWSALFGATGWNEDFKHALDESWLLRERFARVAMIGLMLLRHPLGGRRKVGGADWAARRLFDQVRAAEPEFVLVQQALRETAQEVCDEWAARAFVDELPAKMIRCRWLRELSPFAQSWLSFQNMRHQHDWNTVD